MISQLESEHWQHYAQPPVLMTASRASTTAEIAELLRDPCNSVWIAFDGQTPMSYLRFEGHSHGAAQSVQAETTAAITGAFTRPAYRGRGVAPALLDAALRDYAARGYQRCSVDFESFNPEAATFWMRYFTPVCLSLMRVPERGPAR